MYQLLTDKERQHWSTIIAELLTIVPYMRDAISNVKPVKSNSDIYIAAIDQHWRCAITDDFFNLNLYEQCGVIVHETMHCIGNHFARAVMHHNVITPRDNTAADLEINTALSNCISLKLPEDAVMPYNYELPDHQSYEYYYENLPQGSKVQIAIDMLDNEESDKITAVGMGEMSNAEKVTVRNTTLQKACEYQKSIGTAAGLKDSLLQFVINKLTPAKVDWRKQLSNYISKHRYNIAIGKNDYSYRRVNRRLNNDDIGPGMISYSPKICIGVDISGSMSEKDYLKVLTEIDEIIRHQSKQISIFAMDIEVSNIQTVSSIHQLKLPKNGGGTSLDCGFDYVKNLPKHKRPDIFIVMTDGCNYWDNVKPYIVRDIKYIVVSTTNSYYLSSIDFGDHVKI